MANCGGSIGSFEYCAWIPWVRAVKPARPGPLLVLAICWPMASIIAAHVFRKKRMLLRAGITVEVVVER